MKIALIVFGIATSAAGLLGLTLGTLIRAGYYLVRDAPPEHYRKMRRRAAAFLSVGAALTAVGTVCLAASFVWPR